uniref:COX VIIa-like protein n=1 Tax=Zea mays TaxID=4577 RepID=B6UEL5_MAIZE|nr:COX VIIa-like protein [Zea mays]
MGDGRTGGANRPAWLQHHFQNMTKHTYLKGRYDVITSVAIPLALAASSMFMIGRGVYNMSHGIGKKE